MQNVEKINIRKQEVFDSYFRRYYQILCYFACHYLKEQDEAEDVVQEVFMKLLNGEECFDNDVRGHRERLPEHRVPGHSSRCRSRQPDA